MPVFLELGPQRDERLNIPPAADYLDYNVELEIVGGGTAREDVGVARGRRGRPGAGRRGCRRGGSDKF